MVSLIICVVLLLSVTGMKFDTKICPSLDKIWKFNCSHQDVKWSNLVKFESNVRASNFLDLSNNLFFSEPQGYIIKNLSLNIFKQLNTALNLSSNKFSRIESHAFYYHPVIVDDINRIKFEDSELKILELVEIDLSNNSFEIIPWNSVKNLSKLETLRLNQNPINKLDLGDMTDLSENYFKNLTSLYLNKSNVEYVNPVVFELLKNLKVLDLSFNKIKYIDDFSNKGLISLYLFDNPLICDCRLLWFKNFLLNKNFNLADYKNSQHTCLGNLEIINKNFIIESKTLLFSESSIKIEKKIVENSDAPIDSRIEPINIIQIEDKNFFCDLKIDNHIENLSVVNQKSRKIRLNCIVKGFPEPYVKWLLGQRDIVRDLASSNTLLTHSETKFQNITYIVHSSLTMNLDHPLRQEDISCIAFFSTDSRPSKIPKPLHPKKGVLFKIINLIKDDSYLNQTFSSLNLTELTYLPSIQRSIFKDQPFIYYIIFGILFLFCFFVIILASVCLIRHKRAITRGEKQYGYSGSEYSSINKRSTIYTGSNSLRADSATTVPLKPDVIREHHDFGSINDNFYRTPSRPSNYLNALMISPESINKTFDDNDSVYTNNHSIPIYNVSRLIQQSFDQNPVENSSFEDTRSSSRFSSKTFEENTDEYLEPKFDDLRKPKKHVKQSMI